MDRDVQILISGDPDKAPKALKNFLAKTSQSFSFAELNQNNYRRDLWKSLQHFISHQRLQHIHVDSLSSIKILSRDKTELNEIINDDLLNTLVEHAALKDDKNFEDNLTYAIAIESLKCLCNLIFNSRVGAAISCKNGTIEGIIRRLRTYRDPKLPIEIKFFDMKILFLITALCSEVRPRLKEELHGVTYLIETLDLILKESTENDHNSDIKEVAGMNHELLTDMQVDLSCEILKVLFNLTLHHSADPQVDEEMEAHYLRLVSILQEYLLAPIENADKKHLLHNHVINLLTTMPNNCYKGLVCPVLDGQVVSKDMQFEEQNMMAVHEIIEFLKHKLFPEPTIATQHELLSPVLTTLLKCAGSERSIRKYLRSIILPPLRDVLNRPEEGTTVRNCMCRLLTTPVTQVRHLATELLFVLCKENVNRMIKYTGYGNAAGLFAKRGLLGGNNRDVTMYSSDSEDSDTEEYKEYRHGINPIVGCYEPPHPSPTANMSDEQKEYEALKLVELMHNLTRQGIVKPCRIGEDGRPEPVEHILELQEGIQQIHMDEDDSD